MKDSSPSDFNYMHAFAEVEPDEESVQQPVAQIHRGHGLRMLDAAGGARVVRQATHRGCPPAVAGLEPEPGEAGLSRATKTGDEEQNH